MLKNVEWGEYRLGDLFESTNGNVDIKKEHINGRGDYVITAGLTGNGILGRSDINSKIVKGNSITVDMFGNAFYRPYQYKMVTHARVFSLIPNCAISNRQGLFLVNSLKYFSTKYAYDNMCSWEKIKNDYVQLPTKDGKINYDFMEKFVAELEAQRTAELEAYITASGLVDCVQISPDILHEETEWTEYRLRDLFEKVKTMTVKLKASMLPSEPQNDFVLPALTAGIQNQGLNNYVPRCNTTVLKNVISISANGANTGATFYQSKEFTVLQDAYAIQWKYSDEQLSDKHYLYLVCLISANIYGKYDWTHKAGWERIKNNTINLPTKNGIIDFDFMEQYITAIEVACIAELKKYIDMEKAAYNQVLHSN